MSKSDLILVTRATGKIGSSIARNLDRMGKPLRFLVRDPSKLSGFEKVGQITGDYSNVPSLDRAFTGVTSAFIVSGYAEPGDRAKMHRNAFQAAERAGVRHVIYLSTLEASPHMRIVRAVVHGRIKAVKTEYSEDELPLDPDFATALLEWKRKSADPTRFTGLDLMFQATSQGVITTRLRRSRTTSVLPDAVWLGAPGAGLGWAFGPGRKAQFRTAVVCRCMMSAGKRLGSTGVSDGTHSAILTAHGWTTPGHQWGCSRS